MTEIFGQVSEMRTMQHRFNVSKRKFKSSNDVGTNKNKIYVAELSMFTLRNIHFSLPNVR